MRLSTYLPAWTTPEIAILLRKTLTDYSSETGVSLTHYVQYSGFTELVVHFPKNCTFEDVFKVGEIVGLFCGLAKPEGWVNPDSKPKPDLVAQGWPPFNPAYSKLF